MKYEYGVEYETNGKKPDLPDDVVVEFKNQRYGWSEYGPDIVKRWFWGNSAAFRIVDERYKPVEPEKSWHEKGELPPVGTECEYKVITSGQAWVKCFFIGLNSKGNLVIEVFGKYSTYSTEQIEFHPLKTEREKFIETASSIMGNIDRLTIFELAKCLYDSGLFELKNKAAS